MTISAVVLTHNNEQTVEKTLASLRFCNEILVVDDHSTDDTKHIAKRMGATVVSRALVNDFAAQRNFALTKATGAWIVFVDSDEVVPSELATELMDAIVSDRADGLYMKRQDMLWGKPLHYGETASVRLLRAVKKHAGTWVRPVHEVLEVSGKTATLSTPLLHTPHGDVAHFLHDINEYSTWNARYLYETGHRSSWWQVLLYPSAKFFVNYVVRKGFLDGMPGVIVAFMMSFHSLLTRGKLWELSHMRSSL